MNIDDELFIPEGVDPNKLALILSEVGWTLVGGRDGSYGRFSPPNEGANLLVPLDEQAPEFSFLMEAALRQLSEDRDLWTRTLSPRLIVDIADEFKFRRESSAPSGMISWRAGEQLISSARRTLLAGAKSYMAPIRHFSNKFGQFANRYLDSVLMGQTAPGSYIVTAYAQADSVVPIHGGSRALPDLVGANVAQSRQVSLAVIRAVEATVEAVEHFRHHHSLSGFEEGVNSGVSYEMATALLAMTSNSDGADISVDLNSALPVPGKSGSVRFDLRGSDAPILERAANVLVEQGPSERAVISGRVHLLAKKVAGSPGVFGVESLTGEQPKKVRVRLAEEEDYHEAVRAHEEDLAIRVSGNLEREGTLNWLYNATVVETLGPIESLMQRRGRPVRPSAVEGQIDLFGDEPRGE
ncbi:MULTISPECIES: hypothetical protein [unclassified Streptomyces]|uniref:hypothetical protein n=1 Tax=unclassified Streptomyces TaxID=2593676 RepID=UPI000A9404EE|nr:MULTISPECIES: hypothetical protein [unclassified Streptomyces]